MNETGLDLPTPQKASESVSVFAGIYPHFSAALASGKPVSIALGRLGLQFLKEKQPTEAVTVFRCAVALAPEDPVTWLNLGLALDQCGSAAATACFERSLELSENQGDTWLLLGFARKKLGDLAGCEKAYRRALDLEPDSAMFWQCLGLLKQEQRDYPAAIESLNQCAKFGGTNAALQANLGKICYQIGSIAESCAAYTEAARLEPANALYQRMWRRLRFMHEVLDGGEVPAAIDAWRQAMEDATAAECNEELTQVLNVSFGLFAGMGHVDAARRVGQAQAEISPGNPVVDYLLKALDGEAKIERSPDSYVTRYFDFFASGFDEQLVGELGYDVPEKLAELVQAAVPAGRKVDVLDAGCGTGLCGVWLKPIAQKLQGVDLSPRMLEQAARRGLYDELICTELTDHLLKHPGEFDLIVAADVIIYFGELKAIFAACATALRPGGLLAFSTEMYPAETYQLRPSGRFAHAAEYVRDCARAAFSEKQFVETTIRHEARRPVIGHLFLLRKR